jgi:predicted RNase H-like HicB family nuclease
MGDYGVWVEKSGRWYVAECPTVAGCRSRGPTEAEAAQAARRIVGEYLAQKEQLLSEGPYPDLADEIISWYSWDASWWREWGVVSSPPDVAIRVSFRFDGEVPQYGAQLLDQIAARLIVPYTTDEWDRASAIVMVSSDEVAEMEVVLSEAMDNDDLCLRHELWSREPRHQVSLGHFPLLSGAWLQNPSAGDLRRTGGR